MKRIAACLAALAAVAILNTCSSNPTGVVNDDKNQITEKKAEGIFRQVMTDVPSEDIAALVQGNINFAF
ncbi:MAG: hypothetical protein PVI26_04040, partial [Chitinispirillia bacterium]